MATANEVLVDGFDRVKETVHEAVEGLDEDRLAHRPDAEANSIAWLVWHLARVQDDHVADVAEREQVWTAQGFADRFGLPFEAAATGYGFSPEQVAQLRIGSTELLLEYAAAVHAQTAQFLQRLSDDDLDRVVDTRWDPPVTLGVRLVSIINDDQQHVGQAAYVRGLLTDGLADGAV
jgi:uncharacterized damage-inducible protein DinB